MVARPTILFGVALACSGACGGRPQRDPTPNPGAADTLPVEWVLRAGPAASRVELPCSGEERNLCDAVDNDCDGMIDESCTTSQSEVTAASAEGIQIAATWNTGADIDVVVTNQDGSVLGTDAFEVVSRGEGSCGSPQDRSLSRFERVQISPEYPRAVRVRVYMARPCEATEETLVTISIGVPGQAAKSFNIPANRDASPVWVVDLSPAATESGQHRSRGRQGPEEIRE